MTYDRSDAHALARAAYRKRQYDEKELHDNPVPTLDALLKHYGDPVDRKIKFVNPDVDYLWRKSGFDHRFVGRMLGWFGERVVVEGLRRCLEAEIHQEERAVGLFRNVEAE